MEPRTITQAEAADLLASSYETGRYEPLGLFLVGEAGGTWTGIDNSTGNAWTEEFGTQAECLKWLKGENAVFTLDEAVSRIYELSAEAHMNMARNLKERRTWCEKNLKNYQTIKWAFDKVLVIRYAERLEVYRYYYGEGAAMPHSPHLREAAHPTITPYPPVQRRPSAKGANQMFIFRTSNRTRYARAVRHMMDHPERYEVISRGRDYSADIKGPAGCGWYIHYLKV